MYAYINTKRTHTHTHHSMAEVAVKSSLEWPNNNENDDNKNFFDN